MVRTILALVASLAGVAFAAGPTTRRFVAGVDANYVLDLERAGTTWRVDGAKVDPFAALARAGFDGFRVRLWTGDDGPNGLNYAVVTARRAQAAGLKPYVVIFLSENWADLVKQPAPAIWKGLDADAKLRAIEAYAERVARRFADERIDVDLFEIGNEIDFGLCGVFEEAWPKRVSVDYMRANIWPQMAPMIAAAQRGVRKVRPDARFTLHLAQWNKPDWCIAFWRFMREQGVSVDLAGLSYFPTSVPDASERPLPYLVATAERIRDALGVPVLICETGYPSEPNFPGQFADWNKPVAGYALSVDGQRRWLSDFLSTTRATPAVAGAYYWSPEGTTGDLWRAFALFDVDGNARPAIAPTTTRPATQATSQPTTVPAATGVEVYFGNLHAHTGISDGTGTPAQAFAFARDVAELDFMAIAEHNHLMGGEKATAAKRRQLYVADEANALVPVARRFTEDGKFVAIAGQEFSSMSKGNHVNVFDVDEPIDPKDVPNGDFAGLLKWLDAHRDSSGKPAVMQLNHPMLGRPGKTIEANEYGRDDFGDDAGWVKAMGGATSLIELLNGEGKAGSRRSPQIMDRHYLLYLRAGFRVAPVGNQDNHKTDWGTSTETRTGVIAPALTRAALIDALRARHAYATEDPNLRVIVRVNGKLAGDVLDSPGDVTIAYEIRDADESFALYTIDVYRGTVGGELASIVRTVAGVKAPPPGVANVIDGVRLDAGQFLFLRVTQNDVSSDRAWTAPVWVQSK